MNLKMTPQLERVLRVFLEDATAPRYGYELMKAAKLASGTLYPILTRLQDEGLVTSHWETPGEQSQRPRRYYRLTGDGVQAARLALAQHSLDRAHGTPATGRPATGDVR